jgi:hypothetical protein
LQEYFQVKVVRPTRLRATNFPAFIDSVDGEEILLTVDIDETNPLPEIMFFLNSGS